MTDLMVGIVQRDPVKRVLWSSAVRASDTLQLGFAVAELGTLTDTNQLDRDCDVLVIGIDHERFARMRTWAILKSLFGYKSIVAITSGEDMQILENVLGAGVTSLQRPGIAQFEFVKAIRAAGEGVVNYDPVLVERAKRLLFDYPVEETLNFGGLSIDPRARRVLRWNQEIKLTNLEYSLLEHLAEAGGHPMTVAELLEAVWGTSQQEGGTPDQVYGCIKRLRAKVEPSPHAPRYLLSVKDRGYFLADPYEDPD